MQPLLLYYSLLRSTAVKQHHCFRICL